MERGLYDRVLLLVWGEFGRTPRNQRRRRPRPLGHVRLRAARRRGRVAGQVIGSTTSKGEDPKDRPIRPGDVLATVYHVLGIDPALEFPDFAGRPVKLLAQGHAIAEL